MLEVEDQKLLEKLAQRIVKTKLGVLAIFTLEMHKPLSFVASQFMLMMGPIMHFFFSPSQYDRLAKLMSERQNVELLICMIENLEKQRP